MLLKSVRVYTFDSPIFSIFSFYPTFSFRSLRFFLPGKQALKTDGVFPLFFPLFSVPGFLISAIYLRFRRTKKLNNTVNRPIVPGFVKTRGSFYYRLSIASSPCI
nr:MAG TPA: hypothetical protein [Caudoviricetes sp.]